MLTFDEATQCYFRKNELKDYRTTEICFAVAEFFLSERSKKEIMNVAKQKREERDEKLKEYREAKEKQRIRERERAKRERKKNAVYASLHEVQEYIATDRAYREECDRKCVEKFKMLEQMKKEHTNPEKIILNACKLALLFNVALSDNI